MENNQNKTCIRLLANPIQINTCKGKIRMSEDSFNSLSKVLSLTGNEVRLKILYLLDQEGELCPCDLTDILEMTIPAISQHLRKLKDANLISFRKEGQTIFYMLNPYYMHILKPLFNNIQQKNGI